MIGFPVVDTQRMSLPQWEQAIGERVRALRIDAGLDQAGLAEAANISRSAVQSLELGRGSRLTTVLAVLRALGREDLLHELLPSTDATPMERLRAERGQAPKPQRVRRSAS